jgi:hypothetical protein
MTRSNSHSAASPLQRGHQYYDFPSQRANSLSVEPRRALAVYRALNLVNDPRASRKLLGFSGRPVREERGGVVISSSDCAALAARLRAAGYPLDDGGIRVFKMERGFSDVVRIGPDVATAYARFVDGIEARLNITAETWQELGTEMRNAVRLLMLIGREPETLMAVRRALGIRDSDKAPAGAVLVGKVSGLRLVEWAHAHSWTLDSSGIERLARARGVPSLEVDHELARFVAAAVLCTGEPCHDYTKLSCEGHILNRRTVQLLKAAERHLRGAVRFRVLKGSYLDREEKGAHPHMGGGVVDVDVGDDSPELIEAAVQALRQVGLAAWYRTRSEHPHIHAVAIGDRELAPAAMWQIRAYFRGRDGRSRSEHDPHRRVGVPLPAWVVKYRVAAI